MRNVESVQRDLKNKLLGRIDEVHDDVKLLRKVVDNNLEDIANDVLAKSTKVNHFLSHNIYYIQLHIKHKHHLEYPLSG